MRLTVSLWGRWNLWKQNMYLLAKLHKFYECVSIFDAWLPYQIIWFTAAATNLPNQLPHGVPIHDPNKPHTDWIDWDPIKYRNLTWPDLGSAHIQCMHVYTTAKHRQKHTHTHTCKHTHLVTQTHTHTHVQSCKNPPTLTPTCARSLSVWVHCGKSAFWRRILHHGISQLCPAPLAKPSYRGYGSGKLKQPSQGFRVLWKFKSQVQVVNELWEGERWGRWTRCCHICRRYNCKAKRGGKQTDGFWEWRLVFFFW